MSTNKILKLTDLARIVTWINLTNVNFLFEWWIINELNKSNYLRIIIKIIILQLINQYINFFNFSKK